MAKFILGNRVRKSAEQRPWLRKILWFLDLIFVGSLVKGLALLPVDTASNLGRWLLSRLGPLMSAKSAKIRHNLSVAFPDKSAAELDNLVASIWGSGGAILAEYAHVDFLSDPKNQRFQVEFQGAKDDLANPDRPAVFVSAHLSNWEILGAAIARFGIRFTTLYSPPENPWLDGMLKKSRLALGCDLLPRDGSMRPLVRAMGEKHSVAMVVDRRIDEGELVPFFGHDKLTSLLPARMALRFDCPLVPVRAKRLKGAHFKVIFYPPILPRQPGATDSEKALDMMTQVNALFEDWIRDDPNEWFCTKRLWPKVKK